VQNNQHWNNIQIGVSLNNQTPIFKDIKPYMKDEDSNMFIDAQHPLWRKKIICVKLRN
jgi:tRNA (Thr-GGU) A37 N-methylase